MKKIVAIGGGELGAETEPLDRFIVELSGRENPRLLFVPTASYDAEGYIEAVRAQFGRLGCRVDALRLYSCENTPAAVEKIGEKIRSADIVYVGGGDTESMMRKWAQFRADAFLRQAYERGAVLSGLSAGSICWFSAGYSDSEFFDRENPYPRYKWVRGLGLLPYLHCPHYDEEGYHAFDEAMRGQSAEGFALENGTALVALDGRLSVRRADPAKKAYRLAWRGGRVEKTEFPQTGGAA